MSAGGYLKIGDIKGESFDKHHEHWINLLSVSQSMSRPMAAGASGSTRHRSTVTFGDIVCVKEVDASTPKLQEALADGTCFPKLEIELCTSDGAGAKIPYLHWELKNARVTTYSFTGAAQGGSPPTEQVSFNFEEIRQVYVMLDNDGKPLGKVEYTWKIEEGTR